MSLNLLVLRCADVEASGRFYAALGLEFATEKHGAGPEHLAAQVDAVVLELYPASADRITRGARLGFVVDEVEPVVEALVANGGRILSSHSRPDAGRVVVVEDLDGHVLELSDRSPG